MTLLEFLSRCSEFEKSRNPASGLVLCEEVLASGAKGLLRATALRYRAVFLLTSSPSWANEATVLLREALALLVAHPTEQAPVYATLVTAYAMYGNYDMAHQFAARFFDLASSHKDPEISKYISRVWFNLAYAYDTAGQWEKAAEAYGSAYREALVMPEKLNPGMAAHNLAQILLELGRPDDALAMLQASKLHLDESQVGSFMKNQEALYFLATGRTDDAAVACLEALAHPQCPERVRAEALFTRARVADACGLEGERDQLVNQALDIAIRLPHPRLSRKIEVFAVSVRNREGVPES